jgi:hypothetical protein
MSGLNLDQTTIQPSGQRFLPLLLLLFFASGCAALMALRQFPEDLFIISEDHKREIRRTMGFDN